MTFYRHILAYLRSRLPKLPPASTFRETAVAQLVANYHAILDSHEAMLRQVAELLLLVRNRVPLPRAVARLGADRGQAPAAARQLSPYIKNLAATRLAL
jgi:hypothetical protein